MDVVGQLGDIGSLLLGVLVGLCLSALGLLAQVRQMDRQAAALDEAVASRERLRRELQGVWQLCRELRSALRAEQARCRQLERVLDLWWPWR